MDTEIHYDETDLKLLQLIHYVKRLFKQDKPLLLSVKETCSFLGLSQNIVYRLMRNDPAFPRPIVLPESSMKMWRTEELINYVRSLAYHDIPSKGQFDKMIASLIEKEHEND